MWEWINQRIPKAHRWEDPSVHLMLWVLWSHFSYLIHEEFVKYSDQRNGRILEIWDPVSRWIARHLSLNMNLKDTFSII